MERFSLALSRIDNFFRIVQRHRHRHFGLVVVGAATAAAAVIVDYFHRHSVFILNGNLYRASRKISFVVV